jgi:hypothetical protein
MNVSDDLGNRYDHVRVGGEAARNTYFYRNGPYPADGWYLFPAVRPGAEYSRSMMIST